MPSLPESERRAFVAEAATTLRACVVSGNFTSFVELVADWENTASLWAEPELAAALRSDVDTPVDIPVEEGRGWSGLYSLALHRILATRLLDEFETWRPKLMSNMARLRTTNKGQPHLRNIERWAGLVTEGNTAGLLAMMLDRSRDGQEMREVAPFTGLLDEHDREQAMKWARNVQSDSQVN